MAGEVTWHREASMQRIAAGLILLFGTLPAHSESPASKFNGWLDVANCSAISGWAWDASQPSERVALDLYDGSVQGFPFATVAAGNNRPDLKRVGIGDGVYGFYLATPTTLKDGRLHTILATISGTPALIQIGQNTLTCPAEAAGYSYYLSNVLPSFRAEDWTVAGDANITSEGLTSATPAGAALISRLAVPDSTSDYEVRAALNLKESDGVYSIYLEASPDAMAGPSAAGSFYALELQNPTFSAQGCTATVAISKRSSDTVTELHSQSIACHDGLELRAVRAAGRIGLWVDHAKVAMLDDSEVAAGQPGVGVRGAPEANSLAAVSLGQLDRLAPGPLLPADVQVSAFSNRVELQWPRVTDDPNGTGVGLYTVARDGKVIADVSRVRPSFVDKDVTPGAVYTYEISAYDMHLNRTSTFLTVAVPVGQAAAR
jgi:hypothetical protein